MTALSDIYRTCVSLVGPLAWDELFSADIDVRDVPGLLGNSPGLPDYLTHLAELELARYEMSGSPMPDMQPVSDTVLNPTLRAYNMPFLHLPEIMSGSTAEPEPGEQMVLVWRGPRTGKVYVRSAANEDLLVMKMVTEGISARDVAAAGGVSPGIVERAVFRAAERGVVIMPPSRIQRPESFPRGTVGDEFRVSNSFTLQWHITQACDLHCTHCYDRTDRQPMPLEKARSVLREFGEFCSERNVEGHVSFSGGNPLLYPHFHELYSQAVESGFSVAIMGNPSTREQVERIVDIAMPSFFQISLEGLRERNDAVRGSGHFARSLAFLRLLKDMSVYTMVMLTLTRDNVDDVIPLGLNLEGLADSYNFNRLAQVGEGAALGLPDPGQLEQFLREYLAVSRWHSHFRLKDNLFNILLHEEQQPLMGGCTGFGCGAAFNFVSVLADGEVHACRKFPSHIGNLYEQGLGEIYDSEPAARYRGGCSACAGCDIRPVCGGCLAVSHGQGMDALTQKDRFCFLNPLS